MKNKPSHCIPLLPFALLLVLGACKKGDQSNPDPEGSITNDATPLATRINSCPNAPDYGDSILYLQPNNGNFKVSPVNNEGVKGTYLSWPEGLDINTNNGSINLAKSETGARYNIAFVKKGTTDTCVSQLILGGITYMDSIYVLSNNDTLAQPVFNANPNLLPICDASDDTDYPDNNANGNNTCAFDDDVPGSRANDQKLRVRTKSGVINLKKSIKDGLLGKNIKNGDSKKVKITYSLNDGSKKSKQKITVHVMYYAKASDIPPGLVNEVRNKRTSLMTYSTIGAKPRPPLLIIAGMAN